MLAGFVLMPAREVARETLAGELASIRSPWGLRPKRMAVLWAVRGGASAPDRANDADIPSTRHAR